MPINTRLNALLRSRHPILLAPMDVISGARLTAAVIIAGGFGILGGGYGDRVWLDREIKKLTKLVASAGSPFGIGFITWSLAKQPELLRRLGVHRPAIARRRRSSIERKRSKRTIARSGSTLCASDVS
jgi:NAD(P)H-dependent flavin oxidoreductase YrpB (nitropropane dioxygenase family)